MTIKDNYLIIREKIDRAARNSGRDPSDVKLVVVTKTHPIGVIQSIIDAGAIEFGENYIEDALPKIKYFATIPGIKWHMVGHVQSRKANMVADYFDYLHSLDSLKLAEKLNRELALQNKRLPVWLEINIGGEISKSGWNINQDAQLQAILTDIEKICNLPQLTVLGLMTIPPYSNNPEESRPYYKKLKRFQEQIIKSLNLPGFTQLSMGMSGDFEIAIQEGSTCVRIGQAIFGPRRIQ